MRRVSFHTSLFTSSGLAVLASRSFQPYNIGGGNPGGGMRPPSSSSMTRGTRVSQQEINEARKLHGFDDNNDTFSSFSPSTQRPRKRSALDDPESLFQADNLIQKLHHAHRVRGMASIDRESSFTHGTKQKSTTLGNDGYPMGPDPEFAAFHRVPTLTDDQLVEVTRPPERKTQLEPAGKDPRNKSPLAPIDQDEFTAQKQVEWDNLHLRFGETMFGKMWRIMPLFIAMLLTFNAPTLWRWYKPQRERLKLISEITEAK